MTDIKILAASIAAAYQTQKAATHNAWASVAQAFHNLDSDESVELKETTDKLVASARDIAKALNVAAQANPAASNKEKAAAKAALTDATAVAKTVINVTGLCVKVRAAGLDTVKDSLPVGRTALEKLLKAHEQKLFEASPEGIAAKAAADAAAAAVVPAVANQPIAISFDAFKAAAMQVISMLDSSSAFINTEAGCSLLNAVSRASHGYGLTDIADAYMGLRGDIEQSANELNSALEQSAAQAEANDAAIVLAAQLNDAPVVPTGGADYLASVDASVKVADAKAAKAAAKVAAKALKAQTAKMLKAA